MLVVVTDALRIASHLMAAVADAHTARGLARAIAESLGAHARLTRIELRAPGVVAAVDRVGAEWRSADATPRSDATLLAPGLAVVAAGPLPAVMTTDAFGDVLREIVQTATRHMTVVQRVAELSRRAHAESRELRASLERLEPHGEVVARSPAMRAALERAVRVAAFPTTALITGESGAGKEVLAREIHRRSPRAHRPFLALNCGAIPEQLVESELFGHERGAFTGAERTHQGVFETAHRGTLFLDEVAELPLPAQVKLLRALQERQVRRVGGTSVIEVDVRLIAATNRDLGAMVRAGQFREDLLYRFDVFAIRVPALRERRADLAPLVHALVQQLSNRLGMESPPITRSVLSRLAAHDWPGNVRELMNVLEAALILGGGETLELPAGLGTRTRMLPPDSSRFDDAMRGTIGEALRATRGKIYGRDGAAARLGLKPATLQSKMKKLGIQRARFVD